MLRCDGEFYEECSKMMGLSGGKGVLFSFQDDMWFLTGKPSWTTNR
jgi:hypothetical protein